MCVPYGPGCIQYSDSVAATGRGPRPFFVNAYLCGEILAIAAFPDSAMTQRTDPRMFDRPTQHVRVSTLVVPLPRSQRTPCTRTHLRAAMSGRKKPGWLRSSSGVALHHDGLYLAK